HIVQTDRENRNASRQYGGNRRPATVNAAGAQQDDRRQGRGRGGGPGGRRDNRRPPAQWPCKICRDGGHGEHVHYHSDCPHKNESRPQRPTNAAATTQETVNFAKVPSAVPAVPEVTPVLAAKPYEHPGLVWTSASVNGVKCRAFVDTGSTVTVMSARLAKQIGLQYDPAQCIKA